MSPWQLMALALGLMALVPYIMALAIFDKKNYVSVQPPPLPMVEHVWVQGQRYLFILGGMLLAIIAWWPLPGNGWLTVGMLICGIIAAWLVAKRPLFFGRISYDSERASYYYMRTDIVRYARRNGRPWRWFRRGFWEKIFPWLNTTTPGMPE
ncbi:MAG TPA: hypothetical protein VLA88_04125 [Candidatus Saccharimonadales bacterium]|nr:hypothetical protein [Candidatus Saccharimonadales bacterium]